MSGDPSWKSVADLTEWCGTVGRCCFYEWLWPYDGEYQAPLQTFALSLENHRRYDRHHRRLYCPSLTFGLPLPVNRVGTMGVRWPEDAQNFP
ncbi:hypothetical protein U1Q18_015280 [Sarracenia purpurea var. burkii]